MIPTNTTFQQAAGVLVMAALAFAGTYFHVTLFNSISFIFGSVFALLALRVMGLVPALIVSLAGSAYTLAAWGHPYAMITFACEVLVVHLVSRRIDNLAIADALFWLVMGCPMVLIFYAGVMDMDGAAAGLISVKQAVNGIFNAIVAGFALLAASRWPLGPNQKRILSSFQSMVFYVLMLVSTLAAAGLTVLESRKEYARAVEQLSTVKTAIGDWVRDQAESGVPVEQIADIFDGRVAPFMRKLTDVMPSELEMGVAIVGAGGDVTPVAGQVKSLSGGGRYTAADDGVLIWSPDGEMPEMVRSLQSRYLHYTPIADPEGEAQVVVELSAEPLVIELQSQARRDLLLLAGALCLSMLVAKALSEWLGAPVRRLAVISDDLSSTIVAGGSMSARFPVSSIVEYQTLSTSMRQMAEKLSESFQSQRAVQKTLEERVRARTRELDRMSQVARQTSNAVIITDRESRVEWVNDAFTKMTGYTLQDLARKPLGEILHGEQNEPETLLRIGAALKAVEPFNVEARNRTKSGETYWVDIRCSPIWERGGVHAGFIVIATDVTERQRTSRMLQSSLERIQLATEIAQIGVWTYDLESGHVEWDEQNRRLYGLEQDAFDGEIINWYTFLHEEDRARVSRSVELALASDATPFSAEFRIVRPSGEERIFVSVANVTRDEHGKPLRMTGVNRDVTEDRHVEEALRYVAKRNAAVLDNVVDSIITVDKRGTIQTFNRTSEKIFGYPAEDVIGRNISMLLPTRTTGTSRAFERIGEPEAGGLEIGVVREMEALRRNGEVFPMELAVSELESRGTKVYIGIIRDITERRRVERLQAEFIATVSHELRTPMTSIAGTLSLIKGGVFGALDARADNVLEAAMHNCETLSSLIDEILDLEKLTAGRLEFDIASCDVGWLVRHCVDVNRSFGHKYGVGLAVEGELPEAEIAVDKSRAVQVLTNYISNAVKFSDEDGTVHVSARLGEGCVRIEVRDEGCGIPEKYHELIFKRFSQTDASDTRKSSGSGLGLAITKELAVQMNGNVGFWSSAGQGATFWVEFPLFEGDAETSTVYMQA
ncbi:MAG: PAS domain S-box protein [Roseovarius sp.]